MRAMHGEHRAYGRRVFDARGLIEIGLALPVQRLQRGGSLLFEDLEQLGLL